MVPTADDALDLVQETFLKATRAPRSIPSGLGDEEAWLVLDALPPRRRAVLVMHELEGLDVNDIASVLGITAITVRWHLSRGRRELVRILKPCAGVTDDKD